MHYIIVNNDDDDDDAVRDIRREKQQNPRGSKEIRIEVNQENTTLLLVPCKQNFRL